MFKTMILAAVLLAPAALMSRAQAPSAPAAPTPDADSGFGTALALIDRIQKILDDAIEEKATGPVTIDRGKIDEMRAELAQIRISLKGSVTRTDRDARR